MAVDRAHNVWAAEAIKKEINIPVIASGSITTPELAEEILATGKGDYVGLGRPLWADQYWAKKIEEGRPEDIRPCIRCNEGCLERTFFKFRAVTCGVNPTIGREGELDVTPADKKKKVAVVGGGPGGMEAARVCALRGHEVELYEKRQLGGALNEASAPNFKSDIRFFQKYLTTQLEKLQIKVIEKEVTLEMLESKGYDVVVIATGSKPIKLNIPGADSPIVREAIEILHGGKDIGKKVVVVGGGLVGSETAIELSEQGKDVTIVEMLDNIMNDCAVTDKIVYGERIAADKIDVCTGMKLMEVNGKSVTVSDKSGKTREIEADTVIMAVGFKPQHELYDRLCDTGMEVYSIGDCVAPGKIYDAIHTAYKTARNI